MIPILTPSESRTYDSYAIETLNIPSVLLMENAGRGVVDSMEKHYGSMAEKTVHIYCGKGNNGGDGLVVARHLLVRGAKVTVILTTSPKALKGDPLTNLKILQSLQKKTAEKSLLQILQFSSVSRLISQLAGSSTPDQSLSYQTKLNSIPILDFVVDALYGTGFSGALTGKLGTLVRWLNNLPVKRIAIDIPSGVDAMNGSVAGVAINANLTVSMAFKKAGHLVGEGKNHAGLVDVVDIGIPQRLPPIQKCKTYQIQHSDVSSALPIRATNAHKHSVGKIFVLAGSRGLTGAAAMTSESAMRTGAGAVILGTPKTVYPILAKKLTEVMVESLDDTQDGCLTVSSLPVIQKHIQWADVVVIGPGLSRNPATQELIWQIIKDTDKPLIIDADGLNAIAEMPAILKKAKSKNIILTPHVGELSRITKFSSEEIETNRIEVARKFATEHKLTLVLKGAPTVTASASGEVYINSTGNPGMATAGSGDVLTGIIAGLVGQGMSPVSAAWAGVYIHGKAGDLAKTQFGEKSLLALDIQQNISVALKGVEHFSIYQP